MDRYREAFSLDPGTHDLADDLLKVLFCRVERTQERETMPLVPERGVRSNGLVSMASNIGKSVQVHHPSNIIYIASAHDRYQAALG